MAGFILLCLYWTGNDANVMKHYGSIAGVFHYILYLSSFPVLFFFLECINSFLANIFESLPRKDLPPHLAYAAATYSAMLASNLPHAEKISIK